MPSSRRPASRERSIAAVRSLHLAELAAAGAARAVALSAADEQLDRIARRLPDALQAGLSLVEISRETGISRPTLYELRGRYGESASDLRLAVLQTVATQGPLRADTLARHIGRKRRDLSETLDDLQREGLVEIGAVDDDPPTPLYELTYDGNETLEQWRFQEDILDEQRKAR